MVLQEVKDEQEGSRKKLLPAGASALMPMDYDGNFLVAGDHAGQDVFPASPLAFDYSDEDDDDMEDDFDDMEEEDFDDDDEEEDDDEDDDFDDDEEDDDFDDDYEEDFEYDED